MSKKHIFSRIELGPPMGLRSDESAWVRGRARVRDTGGSLPFALRVTRYGESVLFPEDAALPLDLTRDEAEAELLGILRREAQGVREELIEAEPDDEPDEDGIEDEGDPPDDWDGGFFEDDE